MVYVAPKAYDEHVGLLRRVAYLLGPLALTAVLLGIVFLAAGEKTMKEMIVTGAASLLGMGTTVVFGKAAIGDELFRVNLETWDLAVIVMFVNAASAFWYTYNIDLFQKLPGIGPYLRQARKNAVVTLRRRPWIRRWAVVGVGLFVVTPLPGSGALGGSLMGRIVGVSKLATWLSVTIAGIIVSSAYAMAADQLQAVGDRLEQFAPPWVRLAVAILAVFVMVWFMTKLVKWFASHPPDDGLETGEHATAAE